MNHSDTLIDRRAFIKITALSTGAITFGVAHVANSGTNNKTMWEPNLYVRIDKNNAITIVSKNPECGQGVKTAFPMVVAECLEVEWKNVKVEQAKLDTRYGRQAAGGSRGTPDGWDDLRIAGTAAKEVLIQAAAKKWRVDAKKCFADKGKVHLKGKNKSATYGELINVAAKLEAPDIKSLKLKKDPKEFKLLGRRISGVDNKQIFTGEAIFGCDVRLDGMLYAVYQKSPNFGAKVISANVEEIKKQPGVTHAFVVEGTKNLKGLAPGVAIVADSWWRADQARKKLKVEWGKQQHDNSSDYALEAQKLLKNASSATVKRHDGNIDSGLKNAAKIIEATYYYPFVSHANLEPQNCTAAYDSKNNSMEIWAPTQRPLGARDIVAKTLGINAEDITVNITRIGGGFGRRLISDFVIEAAWIAKQVGKPVQLQWSREDDMLHDHYRPGAWHHFKAGINSKGSMTAFDHHFISFGKNGRPVAGASLSPKHYPAGLVPNFRLRESLIDSNAPTGPWRSPGHSAYCWAYQSFFDEVALAGGRDLLDFRMELLAEGDTPLDLDRLRGVLKFTADKAGWGKKLGKNRGMGMGFHFDHGGFTAHVAEVSNEGNGKIRVEKVHSGSDVGPIINLNGAENQVQGAVVDALSTATLEITFADGEAQQRNFDSYALLRMDQAPEVEAHFLQTDNSPAGLGEPPIAAATPAITNAIFAATGVRIRELPLVKAGIRV